MKPRYRYENVALAEVLDGDTVKLFIDMGMGKVRAKMRSGRLDPYAYRLAGIDARNKATPEGQAAKTALQSLVTGVQLRVETLQDPEKYGRYMVVIEALAAGEWINVNEALLAGGYAVPYAGVGKADA